MNRILLHRAFNKPDGFDARGRKPDGRFLVFWRRYHSGMEPADSIGRLGFARWYERRLIEAHAWFISAFVCVVAIAACAEELAFRGSAARLLFYVAIILGAAATGIYGMVRYHKILVEAERIGEHATCASCGAYARFKLISASEGRCRKCNHEWRVIVPE